MSLARLLAAGKSVMGLRNEVTPYRVTEQRLLPKFGPDKGPRCSPKAGSDKASPGSTAKGARGSGTGGELNRPPTAAVAAPASGGSRLGRARRWVKSRFAGLFGRSKLKPKRQAGAPLGRSPIQEELSLERVRVVRNDLSDSDLELVQLRPKAAATKPKEVGSGKRASSRLAAVRTLLGFFGDNRT